jgi:glycosyltransferase involved in cell wall biosynthesis
LNKKLKIVHLVGGEEKSGAFKGANLLHNDLCRNNIDSKIIYEKKIDKKSLFFRKIRHNFEKFPKIFFPKRENTSFSSGIIGINFLKNKNYLEADIVHLHWVNNGFFNISHLSKINKHILWTLRDMWAFTGGCHYTLGCNKFEKTCHNCPQLKSKIYYDLSTFNQNRKKKYIENKNISFVVNSNWMKKMAKKSKILKDQKVYTFFPSFDFKNFYYEYDYTLKNKLNLNPQKKIILYGAQNIEAKYKGFNYFLESLDYIDKNKFVIVFFGHFWNENEIKKKTIEYIKLGFLNDPNFQRKIYSISDIFVASSLQESFPKTVGESLLCKTPVVYFKNTSIDDICESKNIGGYGAKYCDSKDLANGINWLSNQKNNPKDLAEKASVKILKNFNSEILIKKYIALYDQMIKR